MFEVPGSTEIILGASATDRRIFLVTIEVKFRAVNLNSAKDPAANGRLAFAVAEEFRKSGLFDANGTKLTGQMEEPEMVTRNFGTFRFGMTLKLKNEMQL